MWGFVKHRAYATKMDYIPRLQHHNTTVIATITEEMFQRTWQETEYRLNILRAANSLKCSGVLIINK